jgi:transposase
MRFKEVYNKWQIKRLTVEQAAEILGVHERTFRRHCRKFEGSGAEGLYDARLGKRAKNAVPIDEIIEMLNLFETRYSNFSIAHFYDKWHDEHDGKYSYNWVRNELQKAGYIKKQKKRGTHRKKRLRKPIPGMMLHQDGSKHEWVPRVKWDLIVTMDDATNEIYSAFFIEEEGTWSSFQGVREVIESKGLFCSLYTDRGSHYWNTPEAKGKVDKINLTHFGVAMKILGITMIPAYLPEARGRSERLFRTWQERLPKELALLNITDIEVANKFLKEIFILKHNKKFTVSAAEEGSAFIPWLHNNLNLQDILCIQEEHTVNKDNTVKYKNKILQIQRDLHRYHYVKAQVKVHEYHDGSCSIFYGPRCLAHYDPDGSLKIAIQKTKDKKLYING